ncbi:TetR/AcrR family transcriptional regulator [Paenibacillus sp. HB172176]|uniref:TetR/AcrR family transcriptional regulator n=1 Tax=Paenibacillus sp. HB172176 TaxID=2493690 RepID=UPI001439F73D|nr:TetR/AcrR family transcriptional regulator [Paenibacillus sp. HB172176]
MALAGSTLPEKKSLLLEAALSLMMMKGYQGTTVDEICAEAGVTKGSFFHYFKSKEELGKAAIDHFEKLQMNLMGKAALNQISDAWERLHAYLDFFADLAKDSEAPSSCLTAVISQEMSDIHDDFRALCAEKLLNNTKPLQEILEAVLQEEHPSRELDSQQLSEYFLSIYQGSLILAKARNDRSVLVRNVELFRQYIVQLFDKAG